MFASYGQRELARRSAGKFVLLPFTEAMRDTKPAEAWWGDPPAVYPAGDGIPPPTLRHLSPWYCRVRPANAGAARLSCLGLGGEEPKKATGSGVGGEAAQAPRRRSHKTTQLSTATLLAATCFKHEKVNRGLVPRACVPSRRARQLHDRNLVDPASSHTLVSKIKPCMSKYKPLYGETANGSINRF